MWGLIIIVVALTIIAIKAPAGLRFWKLLVVFLYRFFPLLLKLLRLGKRDHSVACALRLAFEDLGPAYIKFGQMIASSPTTFSPETIEEFSKCLDRTRTIPITQVHRIIKQELHKTSDDIFSSIDETPLASASIAQVHGVVLKDGTQAVIKVQRPGIQKVIHEDLKLLTIISTIATKVSTEMKRANLMSMIDVFRNSVADEMNFHLEADNIEQFNAFLEKESLTSLGVAPKVYRQYCTTKLLTMQRFYGVRIDDAQGVKTIFDNPIDLIRNCSEIFWSCVFLGGFFHGDIHAGNIMVLNNGTLGYLDFGIFGRFEDNDRIALADWISGMIASDATQMTHALQSMNAIPTIDDNTELIEDIARIFLPLREFTFDRLDLVEQFFPDLRDFSQKYNAQLPPNFILICKQITYFGRYVQIHAPDYNENLDPVMQLAFMKIFGKFGEWKLQRTAKPSE